MTPENQLFSSFEANSKADWLDKIAKDLKGRPIEELDWQLEENIRLSPVYTLEDTAHMANDPITIGKTSNSWQIGEYVDTANFAKANKAVLEGLTGGANAPLFRLHHLPTIEELDVLLKDVNPAFISIHFEPQHADKDPAELFRNLILYTRKRGLNLASITGSMDFDPLLDWTDPPFEPLSRIISFAHRQTPKFRVLQVNGRVFHYNSKNASLELALMIAKGNEYLALMDKMGIDASITNVHLQFSVAIGGSYFVEMAKIRALRILWANVLDGYGVKNNISAPIIAHLDHDGETNDLSSNMIKASTQAMSAAIGGADIIFIPSTKSAQDTKDNSFHRRIARNVQHLLQVESHLDRVIDPASGSYYIESLTKMLCEQAWSQFQSIEAKGGFMEVERLE